MLSLILSDQKSLLEELWDYFNETYFSPEMPALENFSFGTGTLISLQTIILGLTVGLIIAAGSTLYSKRYIGDFVRKVIYEECFDAKRAKTLYDLGYLRSPGVRNAVKSYGTLSRWIRCVEEDEFFAEMEKKRAEFEELHKNDKKPPKFEYPEFKRDLNTMHFYIPEDKKYAAEVKFEKKGASFGAFIITSILAILLCAFICYILPDILKMVDNFISIVGNK